MSEDLGDVELTDQPISFSLDPDMAHTFRDTLDRLQREEMDAAQAALDRGEDEAASEHSYKSSDYWQLGQRIRQALKDD